MIPYYPLEDSKGHDYHVVSYWEHLVSQYANISILEVEELNYIDYLKYRRDAFIHRMSQTEKGQDYLKKAWQLEQTKPDREALRKKFGKGG